MSMNVSKALMTAIVRQLVTTLKEVSPVLVTLDSQAMDPLARVNASINSTIGYLLEVFSRLLLISMVRIFTSAWS